MRFTKEKKFRATSVAVLALLMLLGGRAINAGHLQDSSFFSHFGAFFSRLPDSGSLTPTALHVAADPKIDVIPTGYPWRPVVDGKGSERPQGGLASLAYDDVVAGRRADDGLIIQATLAEQATNWSVDGSGSKKSASRAVDPADAVASAGFANSNASKGFDSGLFWPGLTGFAAFISVFVLAWRYRYPEEERS